MGTRTWGRTGPKMRFERPSYGGFRSETYVLGAVTVDREVLGVELRMTRKPTVGDDSPYIEFGLSLDPKAEGMDVFEFFDAILKPYRYGSQEDAYVPGLYKPVSYNPGAYQPLHCIYRVKKEAVEDLLRKVGQTPELAEWAAAFRHFLMR